MKFHFYLIVWEEVISSTLVIVITTCFCSFIRYAQSQMSFERLGMLGEWCLSVLRFASNSISKEGIK